MKPKQPSTNNAFTGATNSIQWKPKAAAPLYVSLKKRRSGIELPNYDAGKP